MSTTEVDARSTIVPRDNVWATATIAVFISLSLILALIGLGHAAFWDDEASVAIAGRNFVNLGHMTGWDGRNLYGYHNGMLVDHTLRPINPPLDILIAATGFRIFGESNWSARFLFVLFGIGAEVVFAAVMRQLFRQNRSIQLFAVGLLAFSTPFLLAIRNCRYYAPAVFFALLALYSYYRAKEREKPVDFVFFAISLACLFYAQYLAAVCFICAIAAAHILVYRKSFTGSYAGFAGSAALLAGLTVPYALAFHIWHRPDLAGGVYSLNRLTFLGWHLERLFSMGALSTVMLGALILFIVFKKSDGEINLHAAAWSTMIVAYILAIDLLMPNPLKEERYLWPVAPLAYGLMALPLSIIAKRSNSLAIALTVLLTSTTLLSAFPFRIEMPLLLPAYIQEVSHPYPTGTQGVAEFLAVTAKQDDVVFACPEYMNYPLLYYVGDKVRIGDLIDSSSPLAGEIGKMRAPFLNKSTTFPTWFIAYGNQPTDLLNPNGTQGWLDFFSRKHPEGGRAVEYRYEPVEKLNVFWGQSQRSESGLHSFGPVNNFDRSREAVTIYRRITISSATKTD